MINHSSHDLIDEIRRKIQDSELSFIVGSGFSKNISNIYPSWKELLLPAVQDVCSSEISGSNTAETILERTGYLQFASQYVKKHGYHEAIDVYIRSHIPVLEKGNVLMLDGQDTGEAVDMSCHELLKQTGVRNIYTFNYDNALEYAFDAVNPSEIYRDDTHVSMLTQLRDDYKNDVKNEDFSEANRILYKIIRIWELDLSLHESSDRSLSDSTCSEKFSGQKEKSEQNLNIIKTKINSLKNSRLDADRRMTGKYQIITKACDISLTENRYNIYKLHGTIGEWYGFDKDNHCHFIISGEDYESYPVHHEPFVNLMRIALLKGSFCLVGFGAEDPNFLAWIGWVKDILDAGNDGYAGARKRIYYICVGNQTLNEGKKLLLDNHYIQPVVLKELYPEAGNEKEQMKAFLKDVTPRNPYDIYRKAWDGIEIDVPWDESKAVILNTDGADLIWNVEACNRISPQTPLLQHLRSNVFRHVSLAVKRGVIDEKFAKIICSAVRGELLPIDRVVSTEREGKHSSMMTRLRARVRRWESVADNFRLMELRAMVLNNSRLPAHASTEDPYIYEHLLHFLFNLDFEAAKKTYDDWKPSDGMWKARKAAVGFILYENISDETYDTLLHDEHTYPNVQEYYHALCLLPSLRGRWTKGNDGRYTISADIQDLKNSVERQNPDIVDFRKIKSDLEDELMKGRNEIKTYGDSSETYHFGTYNVGVANSVKLLQLLLESGMTTSAHNTNFVAKDVWQKICHNLFEDYPYPCLFFTLSYGAENKLVVRVAQEYAYSSALKPVLPAMLRMMLKALQTDSLPENVRQGIYLFAPQLMNAVPVSKWQREFVRFWRYLNLKTMVSDKMMVRDGLYDFLVKGVGMCKDGQFRRELVRWCLDAGKEADYFHNSLLIAACSDDMVLSARDKLKCWNLLDNAVRPAQYYMVLNLKKYCDVKRMAAGFAALSDHELSSDPILLEGVAGLAEMSGNPLLKDKVREISLKSKFLWNTGISQKSISPGRWLDINRIQKNVGFDEEHVSLAYEKLRNALGDIKDAKMKNMFSGVFDFSSSFTSILLDMYRFVSQNRTVVKDAETVLADIMTSYEHITGGTLTQLLLSKDQKKIHKGLEQLLYMSMENGLDPFRNEFMVIFNRLLLMNPSALDRCMLFSSWILDEKMSESGKILPLQTAKAILDVYMPYFCSDGCRKWDMEVRKERVEKTMLLLNDYIRSQGMTHEFWNTYKPIFNTNQL